MRRFCQMVCCEEFKQLNSLLSPARYVQKGLDMSNTINPSFPETATKTVTYGVSHGNAPVRDLQELRLFGGFSCVTNNKDGMRVHDLRDQAKELLALITIQHDREVSREWISQVLWPSSNSKKPRQSLYTLWSYMNRLLADDKGDISWISKTRTSLKINSENSFIDLVALEHLCDEVLCGRLVDPVVILDGLKDLYRGELLPGFYNQEIVAARSMWQNKVSSTILACVQRLMKEKDFHFALRFLEFAEYVDPFNEQVCYLQAQALRKIHLHFRAMECITLFRKRAVAKYALEGSGRLTMLYEEILAEAQ